MEASTEREGSDRLEGMTEASNEGRLPLRGRIRQIGRVALVALCAACVLYAACEAWQGRAYLDERHTIHEVTNPLSSLRQPFREGEPVSYAVLADTDAQLPKIEREWVQTIKAASRRVEGTLRCERIEQYGATTVITYRGVRSGRYWTIAIIGTVSGDPIERMYLVHSG